MNTPGVINCILENEKIKAATFANSIGANATQIYDLQSGKTKKISPSMADKILSVYPHYTRTWLLTGEGDMLTQKKEAPKTSSADITKKNGYITYLLPMSAIENVDFAITVYGDSMAPEYPSGSRILIKKINPDLFIDWGKVYVLDTPNGVLVKEIHESNREGYVSCYSINPDPKFKPFDVLMDEVFGMYRVLMCLSAK